MGRTGTNTEPFTAPGLELALGDQAGVCIQQRSPALVECFLYAVHIGANDRSGVLMRTLLSS
jgi:hypothetical protein